MRLKINNPLFLNVCIVSFALLVALSGFIPKPDSSLNDFANYYTASKMFYQNFDLSDIYDNREFQKRADSYGIENTIVSFVPQSPSNVLIALPFQFQSPKNAAFAFRIFIILLIIVSIFLLRQLFDKDIPLTICVLLSIIIPIATNVSLGQVYVLILLLIALSLLMWKHNRYFTAGLFLGISFALKPFALFMVIFAIFRRRYTLILGFIIGIFAMNLPLILISPEIYSDYFYRIFPAMISGDIQNPYHQQFRSAIVLFRKTFLHDPFRNPDPMLDCAFLFYFFKYLWVILVSVVFYRSVMIDQNRDEYLLSSLLIIPAILIAPVTSSYQYILLVLPFLALLNSQRLIKTILIANFHFFYIFQKMRFPYIETLYLLAIVVALLYGTGVKARQYILAVVIASIISALIASSQIFLLSRSTEIFPTTTDTSIETSGFPNELKSTGTELYFTEMYKENYIIRLDDFPKSYQSHNSYIPDALKTPNTTHISFQSVSNSIEHINYLMMKDDVLHHESHFPAKGLKDMCFGQFDMDNQNIEVIYFVQSIDDSSVIKVIDLKMNLILTYDKCTSARKIRFDSVNNKLVILSQRDMDDRHNEYSKGNGSKIFEIDLVNNSTKDILKSDSRIRDFDLSSDGRLITYSQYENPSDTNIYMMDRESGKSLQITKNRAMDYSSCFSDMLNSEGKMEKYIYFISERGGGINDGRFYRVELDSILKVLYGV